MTQASKQIADLTLDETKGLCIAILRDEFGYKWDYISKIMGISRPTCDRYHRKFKKIYICTEEKVTQEMADAQGVEHHDFTQSQGGA
jgi:hypothetical protein